MTRERRAPSAKESELVSDFTTSAASNVGEVIKRGDSVRLRDKVTQSLMIKSGRTNGFFCCIAELAIKPCRSSRSKLLGEFGIPKHLQKNTASIWNVKREVRKG